MCDRTGKCASERESMQERASLHGVRKKKHLRGRESICKREREVHESERNGVRDDRGNA